MEYVVNNVVKMEWDKKGFLCTKGTQGNAFVMATKVYPSTKGGEVAVFFTTDTAFVWGAIDDLWSQQELRDWVKKEYDYAFPHQYDAYLPVISSSGEVDESLLDTLGISEFKQDIEYRLDDVRPYSVEKDASGKPYEEDV